MQDRYVGDVGDLGKYSFLRYLCAGNGDNPGQHLNLGVVWYRTDPEEVDAPDNRDGRHIEYLQAPYAEQFEQLDPDVHETLLSIVFDNNGNLREVADGRSIEAIMDANILPAAYFAEFLSFAGLPGNAWEARLTRRQQWLNDALDATNQADFVFLDPDNGLQTQTPRTQGQGLKYCFYDELIPFLARGQSLVIYQHYAQGQAIQERVQGRFQGIAENCPGFHFPQSLRALGFRAWQLRFFFVVPAGPLAHILVERAELWAGNNPLHERWNIYYPPEPLVD
jgi:hypothetical protein